MKPFAGFRSQMALIDQRLYQGGNLAIALNLRSQVPEHGRLDIQASKVVNFQGPDCSQAEAHTITESFINFSLRWPPLDRAGPTLPAGLPPECG